MRVTNGLQITIALDPANKSRQGIPWLQTLGRDCRRLSASRDWLIEFGYKRRVKLALRIRLIPDADAGLRATATRFNDAANWAAGEPFIHQVTCGPSSFRRTGMGSETSVGRFLTRQSCLIG